jgi:ATP-binding cassette subfamily B protein
VVSLVDGLLSERFANATSVRLMEHAATLDLEDFEDSELQDKLDRARRQAMGRSALMGQVFGQAQDLVTIATFAAGLTLYAPGSSPCWSWPSCRLSWAKLISTRKVIPLTTRTPERRELDYVRQTGASVETAKEVKIFGLNAFLIGRYRELAEKFYRSGPGPCNRRALWGGLLTAIGTVGYYGAYASRVAHVTRRLHDRRPHVPLGVVPTLARICSREF